MKNSLYFTKNVFVYSNSILYSILPSSLLFCLTVIVEIIEETDRLQDAFTETPVCWILLVDLLK